jgi:hypothetical protein
MIGTADMGRCACHRRGLVLGAAVEALGSHADGKGVVAKMKELPTEDKLMGKGSVRIDRRKIYAMYLFEVKKPEESKGPWDYYKQLATIPAEEARRPLDQANVRCCGNNTTLKSRFVMPSTPHGARSPRRRGELCDRQWPEDHPR